MVLFRVLPSRLLLALSGLMRSSVVARPSSGENRVNNTTIQPRECVAVDGVREYQAAPQAIADVNGGNRTSGNPGYDQSIDYVVDRMTAPGYDVTVRPFQFDAFVEPGLWALHAIPPILTTSAEDTGFTLMSRSDPGDVTGAVGQRARQDRFPVRD